MAKFLGLLLLGLVASLPAPDARAFLDPEVIEAAYAVAGFRSTPRQEALVFLHNKELNLMALQGKIPTEVYQRNQSFFEMVNKGFVKDAANQAGLVAKTQSPKPGSTDTFNPGTDTDIIVEKKPGAPDITEAQIKTTEQAYQDKVRDYLKNSGVDAPDGKINTDTDFMPHPDHTTPAEFNKINKGINERGGTAYESPNAAKIEAQMRPPKGQDIPTLDIKETGAYVTEMQNLANHKIEKAASLEVEAQGLRATNPAKAQKLDAEAQLLRSQASKYIDRIDKVTDIIVKQNGLPPGPPKPNDSLTEAGAMIGQGRGPQSRPGADVIGDVGTLAVNRGVKDYAESLSKLAAKYPEKAAVAQQQIAEQVKHMSPEMREQYIKKAKDAYTKSGGLDPEGFDKGLKNKVETTAKDYQTKNPPGGHDGPAKPGTPDTPTKPGTPDTPTKPGTPDTPTKPGTPDTPTKPGTPDTPTKPGTPDTPTKPGTPDTPTKPGTPDTPTKPGTPDTPTKPGTPDTPTKPGTPDTPTKPGTPDTPTKPGAPDTPTKPGTPDTPTRPGTPDTPTRPGTPDAPGKPVKPGTPDVPSTRTKITNTVGTIMAISDIGNVCDTIEKYLDGKITGKEAAETIVDTTLTLGLIGAGKKVVSSWDTFWDINKTLREANKQNVASYFTQWELQLRKAGMSADEARRLVADAMMSGDSSRLEAIAGQMRAQGKDFTTPVLTIDTMDYGVPEYITEVGEQAWETGKGIVVGTYTGIKYIVLAPSRIVEAWAEGELAEAELEYQTASQEAWMKAKLFQRLIKSGVPSREALKAINDYFSGADMQKLRDIFRKLRGGYVGAQHNQKDWYCTNRPEIIAPVVLPPILQMMGAPPVPIPMPPVPGQR
jgi:hypothetical protein